MTRGKRNKNGDRRGRKGCNLRKWRRWRIGMRQKGEQGMETLVVFFIFVWFPSCDTNSMWQQSHKLPALPFQCSFFFLCRCLFWLSLDSLSSSPWLYPPLLSLSLHYAVWFWLKDRSYFWNCWLVGHVKKSLGLFLSAVSQISHIFGVLFCISCFLHSFSLTTYLTSLLMHFVHCLYKVNTLLESQKISQVLNHWTHLLKKPKHDWGTLNGFWSTGSAEVIKS